ncbi:MAG: DUF655 domain-containing protein [Thermoproteales archaeon]|nr:DUF655 domain-containing protein [Thermoproteales archaeon]RLE66218.1 MAG: DUF655 domain-containing protein [Thermoprotei archaeon]
MKPSQKRYLYYEEYAYILDYLPHGYYTADRVFVRGPVAQAVGEQYFMLLELIPLEGIPLQPLERIYVGRKEINLKIERVSRRIRYDDLTLRARDTLEKAIETIIEKREKYFVDFFNKAQPLTPKMHSLELLRGIGKKTLWKILEERRKKPFETFKEIQERVKIPDPKRLILNRIIDEIINEREKYHVFTLPYYRR